MTNNLIPQLRLSFLPFPLSAHEEWEKREPGNKFPTQKTIWMSIVVITVIIIIIIIIIITITMTMIIIITAAIIIY